MGIFKDKWEENFKKSIEKNNQSTPKYGGFRGGDINLNHKKLDEGNAELDEQFSSYGTPYGRWPNWPWLPNPGDLDSPFNDMEWLEEQIEYWQDIYNQIMEGLMLPCLASSPAVCERIRQKRLAELERIRRRLGWLKRRLQKQGGKVPRWKPPRGTLTSTDRQQPSKQPLSLDKPTGQTITTESNNVVGTHDQMFKKYKLTTDIIKKGTTVFVPHPNSDDEYVQGTVKYMKDWHNQQKARYIVDIGERKPIEARPEDTFIMK